MNLFVIFIRFHYALLNTFVLVVNKILYRKVKPNALRVLVVRKGNLGDLICSFPAFDAIQKYFPNATFDLLTTYGIQSSLGASSVISHEYFQKIYEFRSFTLRSLFKELRKNTYDTVLEFSPDVDTFWNQIRNMLFFRFTGIKRGGGWMITRTNFLKQQQLKYLHFANEQIRLQKILIRCGIDIPDHSNTSLFNQTELDAVKRNHIGEVSQKMVAIAVGAKLNKKQWPLGYMKEVVQFLQSNHYRIVAIGDEGDFQSVESMDIPGMINVCGKLTVSESAAILSICEFTVCNDSGPMHLSYTVGTPVYALFSARNYPGKWNPPVDGKNVVFADYSVTCAGCMNAPCADNICMKKITPDQVIQSIQHNMK